MAAATIDAKGLQRIRLLLQESREAQVATDVVTFNSDIHNIIFDYAGNAKLKAMLGFFQDMIIRDRTLTAYNAKRREEICAEHEAVLVALTNRDGDAAELAMRTHVRNGYSYRRKNAAATPS